MSTKDILFGNVVSGSKPRVLCVDPGIGGTGLAFFERVLKGSKVAIAPAATHVIAPPRSYSYWEGKVEYIVAEFFSYLHLYKPKYVVIEFQELWSSSEVSMASATEGNLFKLTYLTGQLGLAVKQKTGNRAVLVKPTQWKGQLKKKAVGLRIKRTLGKGVSFPNHAEDAVGIGLSIQGKL